MPDAFQTEGAALAAAWDHAIEHAQLPARPGRMPEEFPLVSDWLANIARGWEQSPGASCVVTLADAEGLRQVASYVARLERIAGAGR